MIVKLLTEHHLEFLSLKGGCPGSSESTLVKMPHCWKSHVMTQLFICSGEEVAVKVFTQAGNMRPVDICLDIFIVEHWGRSSS